MFLGQKGTGKRSCGSVTVRSLIAGNINQSRQVVFFEILQRCCGLVAQVGSGARLIFLPLRS